MAPRKKLNLAEQIREMEHLGTQASEAQVEAALRDPALAAQKLTALLEEWRAKDVPDFVALDPEYERIVTQFSRQLTGEMFMNMQIANDLLGKKIQESGEYILPKDLSSIVGELGRQIKLLQELQKLKRVEESRDESELDRKIAALERELSVGAEQIQLIVDRTKDAGDE